MATAHALESTHNDEGPSYLELVGPAYRQRAINAVFELNQLSAALHAALLAEPLNAIAVGALGNAVSEAHERGCTAMSGLGAAISCRGSA